ncbi:unnamed protein product [Merluccius merluccius]
MCQSFSTTRPHRDPGQSHPAQPSPAQQLARHLAPCDAVCTHKCPKQDAFRVLKVVRLQPRTIARLEGRGRGDGMLTARTRGGAMRVWVWVRVRDGPVVAAGGGP